MKMKKTIGASVMSLGLVLGLSGFAGATDGSIYTTGPDSWNKINVDRRTDVEVRNDNDLRLDNENRQDADSGDARVWGNTEGGSAETGNAENENSLDVSASIDNSGSLDAVSPFVSGGGFGGNGGDLNIERTGPDSYNKIEVRDRTNVEVRNNNDINISNNNHQDARSGDASVSHNTYGGDATTGDATNRNETSIDLSVVN